MHATIAPMANIQVKDVPESVHNELRRRASDAGQSLQEYLLSQLVDVTSRPTVRDVFDRVEQHSGGRANLKATAKLVRADRDAR